jgi:hypothetical protein
MSVWPVAIQTLTPLGIGIVAVSEAQGPVAVPQCPRHGQRARDSRQARSPLFRPLRSPAGEGRGCGSQLDAGAGAEAISTGTRAGTASPPGRSWRACRTAGWEPLHAGARPHEQSHQLARCPRPHEPSRRNLLLDRVEEADELLVAMALHVAADDGAVEDVEGCEQRGGAVTFVVVRHRPGTARLHRQTRPAAVERMDLALLVDREDGRMGRRIDVEADDVFEFLGELRVVRQLERADAMRRESVGLEDMLHRAQAHPCGLRQHPAGPVGCFSRRRPERQVDHSLHGAGRQRLLAGLARLVARQPFGRSPP